MYRSRVCFFFRLITFVITCGLINATCLKAYAVESGEGATLGAFKGRSYSIGPAIVWHKNIESRKYLLSAKWLHEFDAENKIFGDLTVLTFGIKF